MNSFLSISVSLLWLTAVCLGNTVVQSPGDLIRKQDESAVIRCEHKIQNYNRMLWYKQSQDMLGFTFMGYLSYQDEITEPEFEKKIKLLGDARKDGTLTITNLTLTDSAVYFCAAKDRDNGGGGQAYFGNGTKLTVLDPKYKKTEPNVTVIGPPEKELCKKSVTLLCVAQDFYPDHVKIKWKIGSKEVTTGVATDPYATKNEDNGLFDMSSRLKVTTKLWNKYKFTCVVTYYNGDKDDVQEKTIARQGGGSGFDRETHFLSAQTVKLAYGVFIAKSGLYGCILFVFVWRQGSAGK